MHCLVDLGLMAFVICEGDVFCERDLMLSCELSSSNAYCCCGTIGRKEV